MFEFSSGSRATRDTNDGSDSSGAFLSQTPITAESFQPPQISCPRAWDRVAVAPVPGLRRQPKIWKRVGGITTESSQGSYDRAMRELEVHGQGERKRARHARHFSAWGDARWDPRAEGDRDGKRDLEEARASVLAAKEEAPTDVAATASTNENTRARPSTFPEGSLKWVPRKRHNSRWPIGPKPGENTQPSVDSEHGEVALKMDEEDMMKRSTRRLNTRFSIFPGEDSPRKLPMVKLAPAKGAAPVFSPVKRVPLSLSPTKVADSPLRSFRVNATPTKVVLESPKITPPAKSPAKPSSSPIASTEDATLTPANRTAQPGSPSQPLASPVPLLFDQPSPSVQAEPQHEVRRRVSLQSARRNERGSSGVSRLLALKNGRSSPNRRHSFTSLDLESAGVQGGSKSRRNTMDNFSVGPDGIRAAASGDGDLDGSGAQQGTSEVVEVDMKANLDIFGQPTKAPGAAALPISEKPEEIFGTPESNLSDSSADALGEPLRPDVILSSSPADDSCVTEGLGSPAATTTDACKADAEEQHDSVLEEEVSDFAADQEQFEAMYAPHEPEGLSTIYEESSLLEDQAADQILIEQQFEESMLGASPKTEANILGQTIDVTQAAVDEQLTSASLPGTPPLVNMSAGHVVSAADAMSAPDSPQPDREASSIPTPQAAPSEMQDDAQTQASVSEDSVATPPASDVLLDAEATTCPASSNKQPEMMVAGHSPQDKVLPGTPPSVTATGLVQRVVTPETHAGAVIAQDGGSGFTPINGRQVSPPHAQGSELRGDDETEGDHEADDLDADEVVEMEFADEGCEPTVAFDDDNLTVEAPRPQNDTLQLHARHDDSETEMLRNFVTRVTADKNAKAAAAAAAALAKKAARRSGSLGSTTSSTGSPMAKSESETPASRKPLGVKSPNSPSPAKKRKHEADEDDLAKDNADPSQDASADPSDGSRLKRRRKRADPILDSSAPTESATPSPEPDSVTGPRRSTRARSTRVALRPSAPSANSIAFSMIPVRLPGMGAMDEAAMDAHIAAMARQRNEEKDLAAVTRGNTRKNKGAAVPPQVVLAKQADDPNWRMRELKGVHDAKEKRAKGGDAESKKAKGVRWDEELVRFQEPSVFRGLARELLADVVMMDGDDGVDEIAQAEPPAATEPAVEKTARVAARKASSSSTTSNTTTTPVPAPAPPPAPTTRRTRSSRLPPPTPIKKIATTSAGTNTNTAPATTTEKPPSAAPTATPSLRTRARSLPKLAAAPGPAPAAAPAASAQTAEPAATTSRSKTGMATRRTRIAKLGMSANGTPAPKRRGRAAAAGAGV